MNTKRKNRTGPSRKGKIVFKEERYLHDRPQRGRPVPAQGVYVNSFFMHAATSLVGNLVQIQTHSGSVYEGVFRTFSSNFDVAIELAQCINNNQNQQGTDDNKSAADCMIFQPNQIVSIVSKEVDPDFATGGAFQTDSAISSRCNGSSRLEEKELEPWEPSGGNINGDIVLELDGNVNGWDAIEMFNKNENLYGVQSTFDSSLAGYTVAIEKKDTQDYKEAEAKAEKIAQEIENNPNYKERLDLENGDEESRFAAVERPIIEQNSDTSSSTSSSSSTATNTMSKGINSVDKYVLPPKRKNIQTGKIVRSTPPPNNNNGPLPQHNSHNSNKNSNFQSIPVQSTPSYVLNQNYSHIHGQSSNISQSKIGGEGNNNNNSNNKPLPQRNIRQYSQQPNAAANYAESSSSISGQMSMGKPSIHVTHNHNHVTNQHNMANNIQENIPSSASSSHISVQHHAVIPPGNNVNTVNPTTQPPPQPQRQPRAREEQIQEFRKFQQDFHITTPNLSSQSQMNQAKTPSVSPHQQPQPPLSPPQQQMQQLQQQQQQQQSLPPIAQHVQNQSLQQHQHQQTQAQSQQQSSPTIQQQPAVQQHSQQQQTDNPIPLSTQRNSPPQHSIQQSEQQNYHPTPPQQQSPPTIISSSGNNSIVTSTSVTPSQQQQPQQQHVQPVLNANSSNSNGNELNSGDKISTTPTGIVKKTHVLNPAAKPFTPRSPSTPNPSRPHTPQTPGPAMTSSVYTPGPHLPTGQVAYVMQPPQPSFQAAPHPHATQQGRLRRGPLTTASQIQVSAAAATGQPLLTAAPLQSFIHYQQPPHPPHFQSQSYQPMVRMYHEPPPQQIQFLAQTPPSTTPSPGQPHQQFHPGPQPSPAGGGPPTAAFGPTAQPPAHFQMMCPVIASHTQLVPNYYQGAAQTPHHAQQFQVIMPQQHPAQ